MDDADHAAARRELVDGLRRRSDIDERTLAAIESVPRHAFVPERHRSRAYADRPLPIGHDQTVSAPHMVALMTDLLDIEPGDRVFEVGTGAATTPRSWPRSSARETSTALSTFQN